MTRSEVRSYNINTIEVLPIGAYLDKAWWAEWAAGYEGTITRKAERLGCTVVGGYGWDVRFLKDDNPCREADADQVVLLASLGVVDAARS